MLVNVEAEKLEMAWSMGDGAQFEYFVETGDEMVDITGGPEKSRSSTIFAQSTLSIPFCLM